eukprot:1813308-Ditylum_brightwellii.AAC.1
MTEPPIPDSVIEQVEDLATVDGEDGTLVFRNRANAEISKIKMADKYDDWPNNSNLTEVAL